MAQALSRGHFDAVIVGGGPSGLSAALTLGRSHRSVLLLDDGHYRNDGAPHMQNIITADGALPADFLQRARRDALKYPTVTHAAATALSITERDADDGSAPHRLSVQLCIAGSSEPVEVFARRVVLAMGVTDVLPSIPGAASLWGRNIHFCPYCHGFEFRQSDFALLLPGGDAQPMPPGVLGAMPPAAYCSSFVPHLLAFRCRQLTVLTNGRTAAEIGLTQAQQEDLTAHGVALNENRIARLSPAHITLPAEGSGVSNGHGEALPAADDSGLTVEMADGSAVTVGMLFIRPPFLHSPLVSALQLKLKPPFSAIEVDGFGKTSHPLVYAAGDCADWRPAVPIAMASGGLAGVGVNHDLAGEDWKRTLSKPAAAQPVETAATKLGTAQD